MGTELGWPTTVAFADILASTAAEVAAVLGGQIDHLQPGGTSGRQGPSRIVDAATGKALR